MTESIRQFRTSMKESTEHLLAAMSKLDGLGQRLDTAIARMGSNVATTLKSSVEEQGKHQAKQSAALMEELARVRSAAEGLGTAIGRLESGIGSAIKTMGANVGVQLDKSIGRQQAQAETMNAALGVELAKVSAAIGALGGAVVALKVELATALVGVERSVRAMGDGQQVAMGALDRSLGERLEEVRVEIHGLSGATAALNKNLNAELERLRTDLGSHLGSTKRYIEGLATTMDQMKTTIRHFEEHLARLAEVLERAQNKEDAEIDLGLFGAGPARDGQDDGAE